ncbi:hypothetical protein T4D_9845 [Trichinella pseudospiralis]|uniref:Uncharacterized protein n=1 Tax=Trichinella pseudospiralis TaxID=6337 RepID=A0A0V1FXU7_TRIPS|nr:hypothetical protein T4D_9845 [Trichinella pseudospiralis]
MVEENFVHVHSLKKLLDRLIFGQIDPSMTTPLAVDWIDLPQLSVQCLFISRFWLTMKRFS